MEFNGLDPIGYEERPRRPFRKHHLRRGIYILPSIFTVANLLCGYYAVLATLDGKVTLTSGRHLLRVTPTSMPHGAVMNLREVTLTPVKE